jgi:crossover junction endodeoxyribonuclease RusA
VISFTVPGRAQPAGSKRAFIRGGRPVVVDANPNAGAWKERVALVAAQAHRGPPITGPVELSITVRLLRPQGHWKKSGGLVKDAPEYPIVRPDLTKLVRALEDALTGIVWLDDSQVIAQHVKKIYADRDEVLISARRLSPEEQREPSQREELLWPGS